MPNGRKRERDYSHQPSVIDDIARELKKIPRMANLLPKDLVKYAEDTGDFLANKIRLKTNQIRKFLDMVNTIRSESIGEEDFPYDERVILLKPKLAYAAGRAREVKPFMDVLEPCMDRVKSDKDFDKFHRFVEAIVAYHRYHGGRES